MSWAFGTQWYWSVEKTRSLTTKWRESSRLEADCQKVPDHPQKQKLGHVLHGGEDFSRAEC